MTALVTGGAGFVGAHIVAALAAATPVVLADTALPSPAVARFLAPVAANVLPVLLDVRDENAVADVVARLGVTQVVHAAAITATAEQERARAAEIVAVNLGGAINVLNAALASPTVARVLLISSSGLYAAPPEPRRPLPETAPLQLDSLYAVTKYSAEGLAARYGQLAGKPMASLRLPSIYGPLEQPRPSRPAVSMLRRLLDALAAGRPVTVAGPTVPRDWTYAADAGQAVGALLAAPAWRHSVYNGGNGMAVDLAAVVQAFVRRGLQATWVEPGQAEFELRPDQARAALNIARLRQDTGFVPRYDLAAGLDDWLARE